MANATADRATTKWAPATFAPQSVLNVPAATTIWGGVMKCADANQRAVDPSLANAALFVAGVTKNQYDNSTGAADAVKCELETGIFEFALAAVNTPLISDVGKPAYAEDNQTIGKLNTAGSLAGTIIEVGVGYVAVGIGPQYY